MKIQIRSSVFETNSSSMHSLVISEQRKPTFILRPLVGYFGEYGWGYEELTSPQQKLSYILTHIAVHLVEDSTQSSELTKVLSSPIFQKLDSLIQERTGFNINMSNSLREDYFKFGYIDHQSIGILDDYSIEELVDIILDNSKIIIDNDNH